MSYVIIVGGSAHEPAYFRKATPEDYVRDPSDATIYPDYEKAEVDAAALTGKKSIVPFGPEWSWYRTKRCAACQ